MQQKALNVNFTATELLGDKDETYVVGDILCPLNGLYSVESEFIECSIHTQQSNTITGNLVGNQKNPSKITGGWRMDQTIPYSIGDIAVENGEHWVLVGVESGRPGNTFFPSSREKLDT